MPKLEQKHYRKDGHGNRVTIGADPEFFIGVPDQPGSDNITPLAITGLLGGTKKKPKSVRYKGMDGFALQEDGVAAEFNIPTSNHATVFNELVEYGLQLAMGTIVKRARTAVRLYRSEAVFSPDQLINPEAREFGCVPDYSAYEGGTEAQALTPEMVQDKQGNGTRFAAGHIHIGWKRIPTELPPYVLACFFDAYAYLPYLEFDRQPQRRKYYGEAGRYRPKPYGIEYRTPSNFWLNFPRYREGFASRMISVSSQLAAIEPAFLQELYTTIPWGDVRTAINTEDVALARNLRQFLYTDCSIGAN